MSAALPKSLEISYREAVTWLQSRGEHGAFCLGYCGLLWRYCLWGVIMNLHWICGLTLYVMLEKLIPARNFIHLGKIAASLLILARVEIITNGYFN